MGLADTFTEIVESLPDDWTDLELDLRIFDERRYVDAAVLLVTCNAQPYSKHDWHWRLLVAHRFGHAAAAPAVHTALKLLDEAGLKASLSSARSAPAVPRWSRCGAGPSRRGATSSGSAPSSAGSDRPEPKATTRDGHSCRVRSRPAVRIHGDQPGGRRRA